jgi:hypothetical protein
MKEALKKVFNPKVLGPLFVLLGVLFVFEYIIYPGLTVASTITNIISVVVAIISAAFVFFYLDNLLDKGLIDKNELKEAEKLLKEKELGETELDYVPKPKPKAQAKPQPKKEKVMGEYQLNNKEKVRKSLIKKTK